MVIVIKKILYTGALSGISKEVIKRIKNDYFIYVCVHTLKELEIIKKYYKDDLNILCLKLDITDNNDLEKIKDFDIDILINNSAISNGGSLLNMDFSLIEDVFKTNVFGTFKLTQIVLRNMVKKGSGKIINMSSLAGLVPLEFIGPYSASKASITNMSLSLKKELSFINKNIKIVIIEPGFYKTGFNQYMFLNKYNDIFNYYFKNSLKKIKKKEDFIVKYIELKNYNSIVKKIVKAIYYDSKTIYKAPFLESVLSKIYVLFFK